MRYEGDRNWLWIEWLSDNLPMPLFFFAYLLFIILISIYMFFDTKTIYIDLHKDQQQLVQALFTSFLIPFELISIKFLLDGSRDKFYHLDVVFQKSQSYFHKLLREKILEQKLNYMLLFLLVGLPLFSLGYSGLSYYVPNGPYIYPAIDIYNNLLLAISIYLLCVVLWYFFNIYWTFHMASEFLNGKLLNYNIIILRRKIIFIRNFFLSILLIFIITISSFYLSSMKTNQVDFYNYFLLFLFLLGIISTVIALKDAQNIVERAIDQKMDWIDETIECSRIKIELIPENESEKSKRELEKLQKTIEFQQKEWDVISQQKVGFGFREGIKEAGAFIVVTIIPILSFLISNEIWKPK
jgi:hypothetical protein